MTTPTSNAHDAASRRCVVAVVETQQRSDQEIALEALSQAHHLPIMCAVLATRRPSIPLMGAAVSGADALNALLRAIDTRDLSVVEAEWVVENALEVGLNSKECR